LGQVSDSSFTKRKAIRTETASGKETGTARKCGTRPARELERRVEVEEEITLSGVVRREKGRRFLP
jgi:hypothetical protein